MNPTDRDEHRREERVADTGNQAQDARREERRSDPEREIDTRREEPADD